MKPPVAKLLARHLPTPTQRCTAAVKSPPSSRNENPRPGIDLAWGLRRAEVIGAGSTNTPGFSRLSGSNSPLNCSNSSMASEEYMCGSSAPRARPSPCSPEIDPPYRPTSAAASSIKALKTGMSPSSLSGTSIRTCTHPSPKCP